MAAGVALASFVVYWFTLAPTVSGEDGGELVAAAYSLGIPHPTGYPLWTMLGHAFIKLIPFGEIAWRVNLMSAFWASGTVALVVLTLRTLEVGRLAAGLAGLILAFSREFWEQSVIAEVYTLNAFFMMLCIFLLLEWTRTRSTITLYLFALIYSLSLSNHSTMYLLGPVFLVYLLATDRSLMKQGRTIAIGSTLFVLGLMVHLYLPIRSMANPAMDWGNPETVQNFWNVFTRAQYSSMMTDERSWGLFGRQLLEFLDYFVFEFTPLVWFVLIFGISPLHKKQRSTSCLLGAVFSVVLLASILVPNFPIEFQYIWLNTTYWIPLNIVGAIWLGFALEVLQQRMSRRPYLRAVTFIVIVLSPLLVYFQYNDQSDYTMSRDYAKDVLDTMEPNAIYFGGGDHTIFPLVYMQVVEGYRTDVTIANQYGYIQPELYADMPGQRMDSAFQFSRKAEHPAIFNWLLETTDRPVYTINRWSGAPLSPESYGLLYRYPTVDMATEMPSEEEMWASYEWEYEWLSESDTETFEIGIFGIGDWTQHLIQYEYCFASARYYLENGDWTAAWRYLIFVQLQHAYMPDKRIALNVGLLWVRYDDLVEATYWFERSVKIDPQYAPALYNLARVLHLQGREQEAIPHMERLLELDPANERFVALWDEIAN